MSAKMLLMQCITHLHAGSDSAGIGIIDKLVQRDPTTGFPCVHASSMKGAVKQFASMQDSVKLNLISLFGSDTAQNRGANGGERNMQQGGLAFLPARLLAYPAQGEKQPYFLVTCPYILHEWADEMKLLSGTEPELTKHVRQVAKQVKSMYGLEPGDTGRMGGMSFDPCSEESKKAFEAVFDALLEGFAVISDEEFINLTDDFNLPVVARNALDDGQSMNLWYEQLVPRRSVFWTSFLPVAIEDEDVNCLVDVLVKNGPVQVGANASVGMGFVKFARL